MLSRALLGLSAGGAVGGLYAAFGRCAGGLCQAEWNPAVPTLAGAAVGLIIVLSSRWD